MKMPKFNLSDILLKAGGSAIGAVLVGYGAGQLKKMAAEGKLKIKFIADHPYETVAFGGGLLIAFVSGFFKGAIKDLLFIAGATMVGVGVADMVNKMMTKTSTDGGPKKV